MGSEAFLFLHSWSWAQICWLEPWLWFSTSSVWTSTPIKYFFSLEVASLALSDSFLFFPLCVLLVLALGEILLFLCMPWLQGIGALLGLVLGAGIVVPGACKGSFWASLLANLVLFLLWVSCCSKARFVGSASAVWGVSGRLFWSFAGALGLGWVGLGLVLATADQLHW